MGKKATFAELVCEECGTDTVPQRIWNLLSPCARRTAEAHGIRCNGGQGRCRSCYQRGRRAGTLVSRRNPHKTGRTFRDGRAVLSEAEVVRLRRAVGLPPVLEPDREKIG